MVLAGGALFFGLAVTFGLLAILPTPEGRMRWTIIPATVLVFVGALVTTEATVVLGFVWPAALILGGLYLIFRSMGSGGRRGRYA